MFDSKEKYKFDLGVKGLIISNNSDKMVRMRKYEQIFLTYLQGSQLNKKEEV